MPKTKQDIRIVILQRGFVLVGVYKKTGNQCKLTSAAVIRRWGTTRGLGELAANGPLTNTKLDPTNGDVDFHELTSLFTIKCEEAKWAKHLS